MYLIHILYVQYKNIEYECINELKKSISSDTNFEPKLNLNICFEKPNC